MDYQRQALKEAKDTRAERKAEKEEYLKKRMRSLHAGDPTMTNEELAQAMAVSRVVVERLRKVLGLEKVKLPSTEECNRRAKAPPADSGYAFRVPGARR